MQGAWRGVRPGSMGSAVETRLKVCACVRECDRVRVRARVEVRVHLQASVGTAIRQTHTVGGGTCIQCLHVCVCVRVCVCLSVWYRVRTDLMLRVRL